VNTVIEHRPDRLPMSIACQALGLNRSSVYARHKRANNKTPSKQSRKNSVQPRALSKQERAHVIETLHSESYRDQPPAEIYQRLLEEDQYLCSVSTMHRLLRKQGENGERRLQRPAQHHAIPRLLAYAPNEVWTWDI
jgi:putative transposase